jgi:hypothetical protein
MIIIRYILLNYNYPYSIILPNNCINQYIGKIKNTIPNIKIASPNAIINMETKILKTTINFLDLILSKALIL